MLGLLFVTQSHYYFCYDNIITLIPLLGLQYDYIITLIPLLGLQYDYIITLIPLLGLQY